MRREVDHLISVQVGARTMRSSASKGNETALTPESARALSVERSIRLERDD
jgi:hypothetical protein